MPLYKESDTLWQLMIIGDLIALFIIFATFLFLVSFLWGKIKPKLKRIRGKRDNAWKRRTLSSKSGKSVKFNETSNEEAIYEEPYSISDTKNKVDFQRFESHDA